MSSGQKKIINEDKPVRRKQEFLYALYEVLQQWYQSTLNHTFLVVWRGEKKGNYQEELNFEPEYQAGIKHYCLCFSFSTKEKNNSLDHKLLINCGVSSIPFLKKKDVAQIFKLRDFLKFYMYMLCLHNWIVDANPLNIIYFLMQLTSLSNIHYPTSYRPPCMKQRFQS